MTEVAIAGPNERIRLTPMRRRIAAHMTESKATSPHVGMGAEIDCTAVDVARSVFGGAWRAREGYGLSYLPFLAWALCRALEAHPRLNASIDDTELVVHQNIHLGVAVDLDHEGLIVPVIRDAGERSVADLAREIRRMSTAARSKDLTPDDVVGGTFTISNPGPFGTLFTIPIINQPQVGILSTEGVTRRAVVVEDEAGERIEIRPVGIIVQSFDHRALDGAYSASFLHHLSQVVQDTDWIANLEQDGLDCDVEPSS
ncbi:MAG TPA: 2-oxo acid dehydrogenase subunit E2 [Acidimicrobiales bacterium]